MANDAIGAVGTATTSYVDNNTVAYAGNPNDKTKKDQSAHPSAFLAINSVFTHQQPQTA